MLASMRLSEEGARVIGSLVEKELTTPQQYPLTLKALVAACNQASNREPVVDYDEHTVMQVLNQLKEQRLIRFVLPSHGRTAVRYRHILDEALALDHRQCALVAVLLLRGPQTIGELRLRTDRMAEFDGLDEVERELVFLASLEEPLALKLARRPGQKEERWSCPIVASPMGETPAEGLVGSATDERSASGSDDRWGDPLPPPAARPDDLRAEVDALRSEVSELRRDLNALRESLGE
jgi:uncharacterized protein YceH (UPF0502 family)